LKTSDPADGKLDGSSRPADECPWPRPFPAGFDKCLAYLQQHFIPPVVGDGAEPRWEVPSDLLEEFPERVRVFFRPHRTS